MPLSFDKGDKTGSPKTKIFCSIIYNSRYSQIHLYRNAFQSRFISLFVNIYIFTLIEFYNSYVFIYLFTFILLIVILQKISNYIHYERGISIKPKIIFFHYN
jgi:hypothetical protein